MTRAGRSNVGESGQRRRRARSPTLTPIRAHQIRDVPTTNRPTSHAAPSGATSYQTTTAVDTFGVSWRTRPAPGSASGHTPGPVHAATALTPPAPRNARRIRSRNAPLVGASSRAPGRAHQPSRRDNLRRERPHQRRWGWVVHQVVHLVYHPPFAVPRQRQKMGGRSRLVPLRWRGSGTTG